MAWMRAETGEDIPAQAAQAIKPLIREGKSLYHKA